MRGSGISFRHIAQKVMPSVVQVVSTYKPGVKRIQAENFTKPYNYMPAGCIRHYHRKGLRRDPDYRRLHVTNGHVVKDAEFLKEFLNNQQSFKAQVVGMDSLNDIALLKVPGRDLPFIPFGSLDSVDTGDWVIAVGNPLSLTSTITVGIISSKSRNIDMEKQQAGFPLYKQMQL